MASIATAAIYANGNAMVGMHYDATGVLSAVNMPQFCRLFQLSGAMSFHEACSLHFPGMDCHLEGP